MNAFGIRTAMLVAAIAVSSAGASPADVQKIPSPQNSTLPTHIVIVGRNGDAPDRALGTVLVIPRDFANNILQNCTITLDFTECGDARLSTESLDPMVDVVCAPRAWRTTSDVEGVARLTVVGGSTGAVCSGTSRVRIYGDGALLAIIPVAMYDLDGNGGMNSADLAQWMVDYGSGNPIDRADYDGSGHLDSSDLAEWLTAYGAGGSAESAAAYCP